MKRHDVFRDLLAERSHISPQQERELRVHLEACHECRALEVEFTRQDVFLQAMSLPEPLPALRHGVFIRVAETPAQGSRRLPRWVFAIAPLFAALVVVFALVRDRHGGSSTTALRHGPGPKAGPKAGPLTNAPERRLPVFGPMATPPAAAPLVPQASSAAAPYETTNVTDGLRITLSTARNTYPVNALVRVHVVVRNIGVDPVSIESGVPYTCTDLRPDIQTVTDSGQVVTPIPVVGRPIPSCPLISPALNTRGILRRGQASDATVDVVLMARHARAFMVVHRYHGCLPAAPNCRPRDSVAYGAVATYHLQPPDAPKVVLHGVPPESVDLPSVPANRGALWADGWYRCTSADGTRAEGGLGVQPFERNTTHLLLPLLGCDPHHSTLYGVLGWHDHSVAFIRYVGR